MKAGKTPTRRRLGRGSERSLPVYVFIAYGEVAAARDAIESVQRLLQRTRREADLQPMLWRFDQLGRPQWREMAAHDALRAHAIVLAMGSSPSLDAGTDRFLTDLTARRAGAPLTCTALMRPNEVWTISLQRTEARPPAKAAPPARPRANSPHVRAA